MKNYKINNLIKSGKVRDIYEVENQPNLLAMTATNRISSFDRHLTNIPEKGKVVNQLSAWWFNQTKDIFPNHLVTTHYPNTSIVLKATPIPIEVVVRGYITGSTSTSLWTHYQEGTRTYCGITFPDHLKKNQKLLHPIITPTTKSDIHDVPISPQEIIDQKIVTQEEWDQISQAALNLFKYGQKVSAERDLILVDTKLEFGRIPSQSPLQSPSQSPPQSENSKIILIDELFTCDSSRYWKKSTYQDRFNNNQEPESLDKDIIRKYVKTKYPNIYDLPLTQKIEIPQNKIDQLSQTYQNFYKQLTQSKTN